MYNLIRISMHDWYAFQAKDVDVTGTIGLIGRSGSGKSTVQDAILTVLLGAHEQHLTLNGAAGKPGGRDTTRNLRGYCLCSFFDVDEGATQRDEAQTTLVLTFQDSKTKRFVACGVMMAADSQVPGVDVRRLFVASGLDFRMSDHLRLDEKGQRILSHQEEIFSAVKASPGVRLQTFNAKQRYVEGLLLEMSPGGPPAAVRFMKNLSQCRHLKEIGKPSEFVRRFVLEDEKLRIDDVRDSIARWRNLEGEVARIRLKVSSLREVVSRASLCVREQVASQIDEFRIADLDRRIANASLEGLHEDIEALWAQQDEAKASYERIDLAYDASIKQSIEAEKAITSNEREAEIERVTRDLKRLTSLVDRTFQGVRQALAPHVGLVPANAALGMEGQKLVHSGLSAAASLHAAIKSKEAFLAAVTDGTVTAAIARLRSATAVIPELRERHEHVVAQRNAFGAKLKDIEAQYEAAQSGKRYLPQHVERMLAELARAGIRGRVLSDLVRVRVDRWAPAVAMILNHEETAILVPRERVEDALKVQRRLGDDLGQCRILLTDRLQTRPEAPLPGSLADMLETDDPEASAFVAARLGRIMAVETEADLCRHRNAITPDGLHVGGLVSRKMRGTVPKLGRTNTGSLHAEIAVTLRETRETHADLREESVHTERLLRQMTNLVEADDAAIRALVSEFSEMVPEIRQLQDRQAALGSGNAELKEHLASLQAHSGTLKREREAATERMNRLAAEVAVLEMRVEQVQNREREMTEAADALLASLMVAETQRAIVNSQLEAERRLPDPASSWSDAALSEIKDHDGVLVVLKDLRARASARQANYQRNMKDHMRLSRHAWKQFCDSHPEEPRQDVSDDPALLLEHAIGLMEKTSQNFLIPFEAQVREARATMEASLKEDLLAKMGDKLDSTNRQLRDLNKLLMGRSYVGGYRYSFEKRVSEEHKDIIALIQAVQDNPELGLDAILSDETLSDGTGTLRRAMVRIEEMLESGKDVETLADYRRYFEFRIEALAHGATKARDFADIVGKLSGGEKEAPYYVAIAATMRSVYYPSQRAQASPGMAVVVLDEAFSKLDVKNTQKLIDHFTEMGLQLVIAAPDNNLATFMQCTDSVMIIHRPENSPRVTLEVQHPKERMRRELARRTPVYVPTEPPPGGSAIVPFAPLV